jgi:transcriptional regulator with XRE-family HTH domain
MTIKSCKKTMNTREALEQSFQVFDLKASEIADRAGISPEIISRFRHGKGITVETLDKIIQAMPSNARAYFCASLIAGKEQGIAA